jgi:hypothetical protein
MLFPDSFLTLKNANEFNGKISFYEIDIFVENNKFSDFKYKQIF